MSAFSQGKGAITIHAPGLSGRLPRIAEKIGMLKPLTGPHGEQGTISWVNNIMLYKQGKHPAETKEFLGGFYIIECEDLDAAIAIARHVPAAWRDGGRVEVRPAMPM